MTTKLARWSFVLALPLSAVLAAPAERAVEVPLNSTAKTATKSKASTKSGNAVTREATVTRPDGDPTISHSIRDWQPGSLDRRTTPNVTEPADTHRAHHKHHVAASEHAVEVKR